MKNILKSFGLGLCFVLMSITACAFGTSTVNAFIAMPSAQGWEAVGLLVTGLALGFMALFIVFSLGAIPLSALNSLNPKTTEKETEDDQV